MTERPSARIALRLAVFAVVMATAAAWIWAAGFLAVHPLWNPAIRAAATGLFLAASSFSLWRLRGIRMLLAGPAIIIVVLALWIQVTPSGERIWSTGQERAATPTFKDDIVTIENVRNARWKSAAEADVQWETRQYDLRHVRTVDLVIEPFGEWRGLAHVFVTFGFADGEHLAISIESRREAHESYSPLKGIFRHFELLYVVGDERDLIGMRANVRRDPVHVYPLKATPGEARDLLVSMLHRARKLALQPEFYHSLTATCASELLRHVNTLRRNPISSLDWRILFPGYADDLAWERGLINFNGPVAEGRALFLINERSALDPRLDSREWSRKIRETGVH